MIINGLIVGAAVLLGGAGIWGVWLLLRHEDDRDPFAHYGITINPVEGFTGWEMPPEIAHDEYAPPQRWHQDPAAESPAPPAPPPVTDPAAADETPPALPPPPVTDPLTAARAAVDAVRAMDTTDYLEHLEDATTWETRATMTDLLSADTMARGIPAIRVDGDHDGPLSIPPEVIHEMEAGV